MSKINGAYEDSSNDVNLFSSKLKAKKKPISNPRNKVLRYHVRCREEEQDGRMSLRLSKGNTPYIYIYISCIKYSVRPIHG